MTAGRSVRVLVRRLDEARDLPLPQPATAGAAGCDLRAAVAAAIEIAPGGWALVPTGIAIALPPGHEAQIRPRSGLAARHGITLLNTPGTVDSDYRGEVRVIMVNLGSEPFVVRRGDRIAQMVVHRVPEVEFVGVDELPGTERGSGGFGHTGLQ